MDTVVLIVGAGPVGLSLATSLSRSGLPFRIIDQKASQVSTSNAIALHARTLELFGLYGIASQFISEGVWTEAVELNNGGRMLAHIDFKDLASPYSGILAIPQSRTEGILNRHLLDEGVTIERTLRLTSLDQDWSSIQVTLEHNDGSAERVQAEWLVGCDGATGSVRNMIGSRFEPTSDPARFVLADLKIHWPLPASQFTAFFHPDGPAYIAPCPEGRHRVILDVSSQPELRSGAQISFDQFRVLFSRRVAVAAQLSDLSWISVYDVQPGHASSFRKGRVFLAGDAAHTHNPAGSPGMNAGIQDAFNLGWKLAFSAKTQSPAKLLDTYEPERLHIARAGLALHKRLVEAVVLRKSSMQQIRNLILPLLSGWDTGSRGVLTTLPEMGLHYRNCENVERSGHFGPTSPQAGDRAPLPLLNGENLLHWLEPVSHQLFLFSAGNDSVEHISLLSAIRRDFEAAYPNLIRGYVVTRSQAGSGRDILHDASGQFHSAYGADMPCLYLIRPDAYICYQSEPPDGAALHRYLRETYGLFPQHHRSHALGET